MPVGEKGRANPPRPTSARSSIMRPIATERRIRVVAASRPTVEDEPARARTAWVQYRSTRRRDAVYDYLGVVFEIVQHWKTQGRARACSRRALTATKQSGAIRTRDPFAIVIFCTSDPRVVDARTRSKWGRALQFAARAKPAGQPLDRFVNKPGRHQRMHYEFLGSVQVTLRSGLLKSKSEPVAPWIGRWSSLRMRLQEIVQDVQQS